MDKWQALVNELNIWAEQGHCATFWWRDDDATHDSPELERLLKQTTRYKAIVMLAVIPAKVDQSLVKAVSNSDNVVIAQHGYSHTNHAPRGKGLGAWEIGLHRGEQIILKELGIGREKLSALFTDKFVEVIVPPWNRIDYDLLNPIVEMGYIGVSTFGQEDMFNITKDLIQANCHCDPIKWKGGARFTGEAKAISMITDHLVTRRVDHNFSCQPTGLVTHHLDMDEPSWNFTEQLAQIISNHPAASWLSAKQIFKASK